MKKKRKIESTTGSATPATGRKRQDVSDKKREEKFFDRHVVKCTIGPFSKFKVVTDELISCVYWMSRIMVHTSHVVTLMIVERQGSLPIRVDKDTGETKDDEDVGVVEDDEDQEDGDNGQGTDKLPKNLLGLYNKVMRTLANFLQGRVREGTDPDILRVCQKYAEETGLERGSWPDGCLSGWKGNVLDQMAKQCSTAHTTHIQTNLFIYALRYLKYLTRTDPEAASIRQLRTKTAYKKVISAVTDAFWSYLTKEVPDDIRVVISRRPSTLKVLPLGHEVWSVAERLLNHMKEMVPKDTTLSQKSEIMFRIMEKLEPFSIELQRQFMEGVEPPPGEIRWGKSKWTFCLCPQIEWRPKHIHVSTTAVIHLLRDLSKKHSFMKQILNELNGHVVVSEGASHDQKYKIWSALFNMKRVLRPKHLEDRSQLRFGNFIATDGVSVSVCLMKRKSPLQCDMVHMTNAINRVNASLKTADISSVPDIKRELEGLKTEKKDLAERIKDLTDQYRITDQVKQLAALKKMDDGTIMSTNQTRIVGLDPGKKSAATWVVHDPEKQAKHQKWEGDNGEKTVIEERYDSGSLGGGEWRFLSGQKQYTAKMNKRMEQLCPAVRNLPSTKTIDAGRLLAAYRQQVALWPGIEKAFFETTRWYQKTKMRKFCRGQSALEDVIARITGTRKKTEQKKVIVAYGDGDNQGTLRGTSPIMSSRLLKKVSQSACVVLVPEFRSSKLCSACHHAMTQFQGQFRMKRCINSDCIRTVWDRDINASINILNLFLRECLSNSNSSKKGKGRPQAFKRKRGCDE